MKETFELDQWKLWLAIQKEVARQYPDVPADQRADACIDAAKRVAIAYAMTADEWRILEEDRPLRSIGELLAQLRAQGCEISVAAMLVPNLNKDTRGVLHDTLLGVGEELRDLAAGDETASIEGRNRDYAVADEIAALMKWLSGE